MAAYLLEKLKINEEALIKNLGTYYLAAACNVSQNQIFSKSSFLNTEGLSNQKGYQSFLNSIAYAGCSGENSLYHRGMKPLWLDVEHVLNETCRELFVEGAEFYLKTTVDDDKMHYEITTDQDATQGLKITQHV